MIAPTTSASGSSTRWRTLLFVFAYTATVFFFAFASIDVRIANSDDRIRDELVASGNYAWHFVEEAWFQGRFYFATPLYELPWILYCLKDPWLFALARAIGFATGTALLGWLCARHTQNNALGALVALTAAAALHVPATFYPVLSYPAMPLGFTALLGGLLAQQNYVRSRRFVAGLAAGVGLLIACLMCEVFVVFVPLFVMLATADENSGRTRWRVALPALTATGSYLLTYVLFALRFRSTYNGSQFALDPMAVATSLLRQTAGALPGFELVANRNLPGAAEGGPWRSWAEIIDSVHRTSALAWFVVVPQLAAALVLARRAVCGRAASARTLAVAAACVVLPNLPISFTPRYQILAHHRMFPYVYSFYAYCAIVVFAVFCWHRMATRSPRPLHRWLWLTGFVATCSVAFASAQASNHHTLGLLLRWYNQVGRLE